MNNDNNGGRWLSRGAEVLIAEIGAAGPDALHCDVLIVGSGYGGAVAASRLAGATAADGADARVYVVERGNEMLPGEFPANFGELPGHVRFSAQDGKPARGTATGVFDLRLGGDVNALLGNGLGGGSLINAAVMERPTADAFAEGLWPRGVDLASLGASYDRAEQMLATERLPNTVPKFTSLCATGRRLGTATSKARIAISFEKAGVTPAGVAMSPCLQCGDCVTGCNHGAKKSLDTNYLAVAKANGARLFCGATVHTVQQIEGGKGFAVAFFLTDPGKARHDRAVPYVVRARRVILAAGTFGSTEILLRSRAAGLPVPGSPKPECSPPECGPLGSGFSGNGDMIAVAYGQHDAAHASAREGDRPADRGIGPTITGLLQTDTAQGRPLVIEEFAIPGPLRRLLAEVVTTAGALHGLARADRSRPRTTESLNDPAAVDDRKLECTSIYGMMGDDGAGGTLEFIADATGQGVLTDGQVHVAWEDVGSAPVFDAQIDALHKAHDGWGGLGGSVIPNPLWRPLPRVMGLNKLLPPGPTFTVHPLGGCRMADTARNGVVDSYGRVFRIAAPDEDDTVLLDGLAVLDGAIVPVSLGINPSLTIAALAERAVPELARCWGLALRGTETKWTVPRPRRRDLSEPRPPRATTIALQERLTGRLHFAGRTFEAGAVVNFAPTSVGKLRTLPRNIAQPKVVLTLRDAQGVTELTCEGNAQILMRERSHFRDRVLRTLRPAMRRLQALGGGKGDYASWQALVRLCSHLGQVRLLTYRWTVTAVSFVPARGSAKAVGAPVKEGDCLELVKRLEFVEGANAWRQLSEGTLSRTGHCTEEWGRLVLDPGYFAETLVPLLAVKQQHDQPNQLGDLVELGLWLLRMVLGIHLLNFLPPGDTPSQSMDRLPGVVDGVVPDLIKVPPRPGGPPSLDALPCRLLSRYRRARAGEENATVPLLRPVLLIHGYGASGSTFAHPSIDRNLVHTLLAAGRDVWVLDLRTSIGLEQRVAWSFDDVAQSDIPDAVAKVLACTAGEGHDRVDVVAHCIGAAMFSVAVLRSPNLHLSIGAVVLSQVGPLLRASAFNRFRGFVASYLDQFIGTTQFDTRPTNAGSATGLLIDAVLATFPYPDGDGEAERLKDVPGFAAVRHRADAIFGQTMRLANIGDDTLKALDSIYGWVMVRSLAQVSHYAREQVLTDAGGDNRAVAFEEIARKFNFPVLFLHGKQNAVFDWKGSYDSYWLLHRVFDDPVEKHEPPVDTAGDITLGETSERRLLVLADYAHQDTLIGRHAHRDVFPHIVDFLNEFKTAKNPSPSKALTWLARLPWTGPWLGRVQRASRTPGLLSCRLAVHPPPAHASATAIVYVPAKWVAPKWDFQLDLMVGTETTREDLLHDALEVALRDDRLAEFQGFAVLTIHNDLPIDPGSFRIFGTGEVDGLFADPAKAPLPEVLEAVQLALSGDPDLVALAVVRLDPAWLGAVQMPGAGVQNSLCLALASCQYPPGLVDREPAQASYVRLAARTMQDAPGRKPQLLLTVGDQVYVDQTAGVFDPGGGDNVGRAYMLNFRLAALRAAMGSVPTCPLLDDHEVVDNWEPGDPATLYRDAERLAAYVRNQHKLVSARTATPFDYVISPAGVPIYVLDTRSMREPRTLRPVVGGSLLESARLVSATSMQLLTAWLQATPADVPKFIVSSVPVFPLPLAALSPHVPERLGLDDWSGYPHSQFELLRFLRDHAVGQVILLSGDRHMSSVSSLRMNGARGPVEVISVVSSGLYAPWPFANARADEFWLDGPFVLHSAAGDIEGEMTTAAVDTGDGFAVVSVERSRSGGWVLDVTLDQSIGSTHCIRVLGEFDGPLWQVGGPSCWTGRQADPSGGAHGRASE